MVRRGTPASRSRLFRILNPIMRLMLRHFPLRPRRGQLLLLSYTGRTTGKRRTLPVSYVADADESLLVPGGGAWKWNLEDGRPVQIRLLGEDRQAIPEVIFDAREIERLLPTLIAANPIIDRFIGVSIGPDGRPDRASLDRSLEEGFAIVRLRPEVPR